MPIALTIVIPYVMVRFFLLKQAFHRTISPIVLPMLKIVPERPSNFLLEYRVISTNALLLSQIAFSYFQADGSRIY